MQGFAAGAIYGRVSESPAVGDWGVADPSRGKSCGGDEESA